MKDDFPFNDVKVFPLYAFMKMVEDVFQELQGEEPKGTYRKFAYLSNDYILHFNKYGNEPRDGINCICYHWSDISNKWIGYGRSGANNLTAFAFTVGKVIGIKFEEQGVHFPDLF